MGFSGLGMLPILKELGDNLAGVEVGVCRGENIKALLDHCSNIRKITGVDPWSEYMGKRDIPVIDQNTQELNYDYAKKLLRSYMIDDNVALIRKPSLEAVDLFDDESLDFVYIDGDHAYQAALDDMFAWHHKVKHGGILAGHDYRPKDVEVRAAVKKFSETVGLEVVATEYWSWYVVKP